MPEQQRDITQEWKRNFNIAYALGAIYQRALIIPMRSHFGSEALGMTTFLAFVLMCLWYVATHDNFMLFWIGAWLICLIKRRIESSHCAVHVPSQYDGVPRDAMMFTKSERMARMVGEPIIVGVLGTILFWIYEEYGWSPTGLPYFFLGGIVVLPFVEGVSRTIWERKIQAMRDARIEQQCLMEDYRNRYGNS